MNDRQAVKGCPGRPAIFVGWRTIDEGWKPCGLAGCRDVLDVKEATGPILYRFYVGDFWIPLWLPAIESDASTSCQLAAWDGLPATKETKAEEFYGRRYA